MYRPPGGGDREGADANRDALQRRDLRHVDDVANVEPVARDLDPREAVDREVPERVRRRGCDRQEQIAERGQGQQALHDASLLRVEVQSTEKWELSATARRAQGRGSWPRQRSISAR